MVTGSTLPGCLVLVHKTRASCTSCPQPGPTLGAEMARQFSESGTGKFPHSRGEMAERQQGMCEVDVKKSGDKRRWLKGDAAGHAVRGCEAVVPPLNRAGRAPLGKRRGTEPRGCSRPNIPNAENPSAKAGGVLPVLPSKRRYCK